MCNKSKKTNGNLLLAVGAIIGAAAVAAISLRRCKANTRTMISLSKNMESDDRQGFTSLVEV